MHRMADVESILTVAHIRFRPSRSPKDVARFSRYIQYRDVHPDSEKVEDIDGLVRYAQYRDPTSPRGRLFDQDRGASDQDRTELVEYVSRSQPADPPPGKKLSTTSEKAVYRMLISPEESRGLDLQRLTRATMDQLAKDVGAKLPRWLAAEHRNTQHPHVHIILPCRREVSPGNFRTFQITDQRLDNMKQAMHVEIHRQRSLRLTLAATALRAGEAGTESLLHTEDRPLRHESHASSAALPPVIEMLAWSRVGNNHLRAAHKSDASQIVARMTGRLARYNQREAERLARQRHRRYDEEELESRGRVRHG